MKRRTVLLVVTVVVLMVAVLPLRGSVASLASQPEASAPQQGMPEIPDLRTLLNYPFPAHVMEVEDPVQRETIINNLMARPEAGALVTAMADKGFVFDPAYVLANAEVMLVHIVDEGGFDLTLQALTVERQLHDGVVDLSGALTVLVGEDGYCFGQAHHTNLDPHLAEVPDPPILYNGMPYFYITTLRWAGPPVDGRIVYWNYWWFDSHHHPNWYYAHYYWYWKYYLWYWDWPGPYWYYWVYGWYYWRYWYFWSTYFPWVDYPYPVQ